MLLLPVRLTLYSISFNRSVQKAKRPKAKYNYSRCLANVGVNGAETI